MAVNCSAFPGKSTRERTFRSCARRFHRRDRRQAGKFQVADGGTLLLDEIGEMPLSLQPKILRVLQEREVDRLGDTHPVPINVRVIATTNRSLFRMIEAGTFRDPTFITGLNVIPFSIPPLRERREDILELAEHFLRKYEPKAQRAANFAFHSELAVALREHDWPGNVRELENFVRRALALTHSEHSRRRVVRLGRESDSLPPKATLPETRSDAAGHGAAHSWKRRCEATNGNRTRTAEMMGVSLRTVRNKIREYGLAPREAV